MASSEFKTAIKASEREIKAYIDISYETPLSNTGWSVGASEAELSFKNSIIDGLPIKTNYASFENNYFKTDGSMILANNPLIDVSENIGLISNSVFDGTDKLVFTLSKSIAYPNDGITILFGEEYPTDGYIELRFYVGGFLQTEEYYFENNDKNNLIVPFTGHLGTYTLDSIVLHVTNATLGHRIRVSQVYLGIKGLYKDSEVISININEDTDTTNETTPASDCSIVLDNYDDKFDILDTTSLAKYLKNRIEIRPYIGCVLSGGLIEYEPMGLYYLTDWENNQDLTTQINAQNYFTDILKDRKIGYRGSSISELFTYLGITSNINNTYNANLDAIAAKDISALQYLQYLLIVNNAYLYFDRQGVPCVDDINTISEDTYSLSNFSNYPQVNINKKVQKVIVNYNKYTAYDSGGLTDVYNETVTHDDSGITTIFVNWNTPYLIDYTDPLDFYVSTGTITSKYVGYYSAEVTVSSATDFDLVIKGYPITSYIATQYIAEDTTVTDGDTIILDLLSDGADNADVIANNILNNSCDYTITTEGQQDPSIIAGKMISVETKNGYKNILVNKLNFKYNGGLNGTIEGVTD